MSDRISETDKVEFFDRLGMSRSTRNVVSYGLLGVSSIAGLALTAYKITNPAVMIGCVVMNGVAHFMKCSKHDYKMQLRERDETIRRLSAIETDATEMTPVPTTEGQNPLTSSQSGLSLSRLSVRNQQSPTRPSPNFRHQPDYIDEAVHPPKQLLDVD